MDKTGHREDLACVAAECLGYRTRVAERTVTRYFNSHFNEVGLTAVQFGLLVGIELSERPSVAELAERSGADPSTLARNLQLLESAGLVDSRGGRGRSGKRFVLSRKGRRAVQAALPLWERAYRRLVERIGPAQARAGLKFLAALEAAAKPIDG